MSQPAPAQDVFLVAAKAQFEAQQAEAQKRLDAERLVFNDKKHTEVIAARIAALRNQQEA